jgi:hypothetical protein
MEALTAKRAGKKILWGAADSSCLHGIAGIFPGLDPSIDDFDVGETLFHKALGQTGRSVLLGSGAIEDHFLIRVQLGQTAANFGPALSALQKDVAAFARVAIGAYKLSSSDLGCLSRLPRRNAGYFAHGNVLLVSLTSIFSVIKMHN